MAQPIRFSICSELFSIVNEWDFYKTTETIAKLGADVELAPFTEGKPVTDILYRERLKRRSWKIQSRCSVLFLTKSLQFYIIML